MRLLVAFVLGCLTMHIGFGQTQVSVKIKKEVNGQTTVEEKSFDLLPGESLEDALVRNNVDKKGAKEFSISIEDKKTIDENERLKMQGKRLSLEGLPFLEMPPFAPRAYLGVTLRNGKHHPVITDIAAQSPAEKAHLQAGDIICKVDGIPVHRSEDIVNIIRVKSPNESVVLKIKRHHKHLKLCVPLEAIQSPPLVEDFPFPFGNFPEIRIEQLEFDQKPSAFLGVIPNNDFSDMGVKVDSVIGNSAAEKMGLLKNDIIIALNGNSIENFDVLKNVISESIPGDGCEVTIIREEKTSILKGNFGNKALIERDGYRIYRNEKGLDDQGQINLDYEFDMDELEKMDSTMNLNITENGIFIGEPNATRQMSLHTVNAEALKSIANESIAPSSFEQLSFMPQPQTESLDIILKSEKPTSIRVVVQDSKNGILFSDERPKPIPSYQGMIRWAGWEKGSYYLMIYQNEKLVIIKELKID